MSALEKFAAELKAKRETLGISISDIYEITRIDKNYLEAMEEANFDIMPDVYMRAFIRKYADAVQLNSEETIKKYEAATSGEVIDEEIKPTSNEISQNNNHKEPIKIDSEPEQKVTIIAETNYNPYIIISFIVAIVIIGYFYYAYIYTANNEIIVEQRVEDIISERNSATKSPRFKSKEEESGITSTNNNGTNASIVKSDSLTLKINALDTVWFRTNIDETKKDEFILNPNRSKTLSAKSQIDILVGNTGGIEFILNGKKLEFAGKKGEIRNIRIDSDGIHLSKIETPIKK